MKNQSVYYRKLFRILKSTFCEIDTLPAYTVSQACAHIVQISYLTTKKSMKPAYSALIALRIGQTIDVEFARPLSPETGAKLQALKEYEGIDVIEFPKLFKKCGFVIYCSEVWDRVTVAKECLEILKAEGFSENTIQLLNFKL
jgi:hypothetical protein